MADRVVLCGANSYEKKYYFNKDFSLIPEAIFLTAVGEFGTVRNVKGEKASQN